MDLFWRQGYESTSISDLTSAIGITAPSLYAAFGDKERISGGRGALQVRPREFRPHPRRGDDRARRHRAASRSLSDRVDEYQGPSSRMLGRCVRHKRLASVRPLAVRTPGLPP